MSVSYPNDRDRRVIVPQLLREQLVAFRNRVWTAKVAESISIVMVAVLVSLLLVMTLDRFWDTPRLLRSVILLLLIAVGFVVPWALYRWVWKCRSLDQIARLLRVREPGVGGQLLGVIELAECDREQSRSPALCQAAMVQVAEMVKQRDLAAAVPPTLLRLLATVLAVALLLLASLAVVATPVLRSGWDRLMMPWRSTPRYTFVEIESLADWMIVPHGESAPWQVSLKPESRWRPATASLHLDGLSPIIARRESNSYAFELPPRNEVSEMQLQVGDAKQSVLLVPKLRPALTSVVADMHLPDYLQRPDPIQVDVRGGTLRAVQGSYGTVAVTASSPLRTASVNGVAAPVWNDSFTTSTIAVENDSSSLRLEWSDEHGLVGLSPFELHVEAIPDAAPTVAAQNLARESVLLETDQVNFQLLALDDFGIKRVGLQWNRSTDAATAGSHGEKVLASGETHQSSLLVDAVFSAQSLGIQPGIVELRLWAEDYLPGRERQYSTPYTFYVMTASQHAQWIANQMEQWHDASLDVRDRERGLHERNKQLRAMQQDAFSSDQVRNELRKQVTAENANARQLAELTKQGESLLRQASHNTEIEAEQVQQWAEMLQMLDDISENRMPSVADLLEKAAAEQATRKSDAAESATNAKMPSSKQQSSTSSSDGDSSEAESSETPNLVDQESSQQPTGPAEPRQEQPGEKESAEDSHSRLDRAVTIVTGPVEDSAADSGTSEAESPTAESSLDAAIEEQEKLLAEFEKVSDDLDAVMANLEGSTLVKRLKAASRQQAHVADQLAARIAGLFGAADSVSADDRVMLKQLATIERDSSRTLAAIMSDVDGYYRRRNLMRFKLVLEEMKQLDVLSSLAKLSQQVTTDQGLVMAQAEFWSDTLDRWADDLIENGDGESESDDKKLASLPPKAILEMLRILEGEVDLREATRVAEQSKASISDEEYRRDAIALSDRQTKLRQRSERLANELESLPDGLVHFEGDINLLMMASQTMNEAASLLRSPSTGSETIAAQTEVIEMLLRSKRINPQGGGDGGANPEGGGQGETDEQALALLGAGLNANEKLRDSEVRQMTGESGRSLPEEFRSGLGEYFRRLEESR
ncbi:hypothetical protein [Novipirellula caenicola]|uniref:Chromosome partition protein Smc n=1 Tax=Novipirellula caenicola TaxID=1536901 RepID=A0ABP9VMR0_9BACT